MASTSLRKEIAIDFAKKKAGTNHRCVLLILEFPEICYTAIDLSMGERLSKYPHEKEVLLLPGTLFEVREVTKVDKNGWCQIRLENITVPRKILFEALHELQNA